MIYFVVPAHNEEALLARTLRSIQDPARRVEIPFELIVVDDNSTDRTSEIALQAGARVVSVSLRKISAVRNAGATSAAGDVLIFVDADTVLPEKTLRSALTALRRGAVGGGAVVRFDETLPLWSRGMLFSWNLTSRILRWAAGCFIFVRKEAFEAAGGFDERYFAGEEIVLSEAMKRRGRFVILGDSVLTSGRKPKLYGFRETVRILGGLALRGSNAWQRRDGLDLWYNRRASPQSPGEKAE